VERVVRRGHGVEVRQHRMLLRYWVTHSLEHDVAWKKGKTLLAIRKASVEKVDDLQIEDIDDLVRAAPFLSLTMRSVTPL
jgi:hypothetical protein